MKNWRDNYIKVAKGGRPVWKWTNTLLKCDHFCDDKPVFVEKKQRKEEIVSMGRRPVFDNY